MTNQVIVGDCLDILADVPAGSGQVVITSPPYPQYRGFNLSVPEWLAWFRPRLGQMSRVLSPTTGVLALNVHFPNRKDAATGRATWMDERLYTEILPMALNAGFCFLNLIPWVKSNPVPSGNLARGDHNGWEPVFLFARSSSYVYSPYYRPYAETAIQRVHGSKPRGGARYSGSYDRRADIDKGRHLNPNGARQPNYLVASPTGGNVDRPRARHGSFPGDLPARFIAQYSKPGDLIIDPFCGSGTTLIEAQRAGRAFLGIDTDPGEVEKALDWLQPAANNED